MKVKEWPQRGLKSAWLRKDVGLSKGVMRPAQKEKLRNAEGEKERERKVESVMSPKRPISRKKKLCI